MSIARIPVQAERDRAAMADYLVDLAGKIRAGRAVADPYGVVVALVGPEDVDVGSKGVRYRHDYARVIDQIRAETQP